MNLRPLLFGSALGLAAGIATAGFTQQAVDPGKKSSSPAAVESIDSSQASAAAREAGRLAFPGDDGRIARVFSALQVEGYFKRRSELFQAVRDVRPEEFPALLKHVHSTMGDRGWEIIGALVQRWFELDVPAASAWSRAHWKQYDIAPLWAKADPAGAMDALRSLDPAAAQRLASFTLEASHPRDYAAQYAIVRGFPPGATRDLLQRQVMERWATTDPLAVLAVLDELPNPAARENVRLYAFMEWSRRDPDRALEQVAELLPTLKAGVLGNSLITGVSQTLAEQDPRRAMAWLTELPPEFSTLAAVRVGRIWADKEPVAALQWCLEQGVDITMPEWNGGDSWHPAILASAMSTAPEETFAMLAAMPAGADRDRMVECAFMESLSHTPGDRFFQEDEQMAWSFYEQLGEDAQIARASLYGQRRAEHGELKDLSGWAQKFPAGPARDNAISGAIRGSYGRNAAQAEALVATLPQGSERNAALSGLARSMAFSAPAEAAARALQIDNALTQQDTLEIIITPWLESKPEESRKWLEATPTIPTALKQQWLQGR